MQYIYNSKQNMLETVYVFLFLLKCILIQKHVIRR